MDTLFAKKKQLEFSYHLLNNDVCQFVCTNFLSFSILELFLLENAIDSLHRQFAIVLTFLTSRLPWFCNNGSIERANKQVLLEHTNYFVCMLLTLIDSYLSLCLLWALSLLFTMLLSHALEFSLTNLVSFSIWFSSEVQFPVIVQLTVKQVAQQNRLSQKQHSTRLIETVFWTRKTISLVIDFF